MIIECPHCLTRFRLDPRQVADSRSMLKCTRCRRVFPVPGQAPPARQRQKPPPREENLSFTFDDDDDWQAPELAPEDVPEEQFLLNVRAADAGADEGAEEGDEPPPAAHPSAGQPVAVTPPRPPVRRATVPDDDVFTMDEEAPVAPTGGGISVRSVFVFLFLVVCGYGALTWSLLDDPDWAGRLAKALPLVGANLRDRNAGGDVALIDVQARYERTKEGKLVFLVTGKAVNQSAEPLRGVQILAKLYDGGERPLSQQVTACGTPLEARIKDLSIHQVAILRGIKPPPEFGVLPGGQCPFVSIFIDVPPGLGGFSTELARAERQA